MSEQIKNKEKEKNILCRIIPNRLCRHSIPKEGSITPPLPPSPSVSCNAVTSF